MQLTLPTTTGMRIIASASGAAGLAQALRYLQSVSEEEVRSGAVPPLYRAGVRYARERGEDWLSPSEVLARGSGDCEDLAAWRAAELRVSGVDDTARAIVVPASVGRGREHHSVVLRHGGTIIEDPSSPLGLGAWPASRAWVAEDRAGNAAQVRAAIGPLVAFGRARDVTPARALGAAWADALGRLAGVGLDVDVEGIARAAHEDAARYYAVGSVGGILDSIPWEGLASDAAAAAVSAAGGGLVSAISSGLGKLASWLTGGPYDAFSDYLSAVGKSDAGIDVSAMKTPAEKVAAILARGWIPFYCSDSVGARDELSAAMTEAGWSGWKKWGQSYDSGAGKKTWWYGVHAPAASAPSAMREAAGAAVRGAEAAALSAAVAVVTNTKGQFKAYGGDGDLRRVMDAGLRGAAAALALAAGRGSTSPDTAATDRQRTDLVDMGSASLVASSADAEWAALRAVAERLEREGVRSRFASLLRAVLR